MTVAAVDFVRYIAADLPECPEIVVEMAVQTAAQDFFRETALWVIFCDPVTSDIGAGDMEVDIPNETMIGVVHSVEVAGRRVPHITQRDAEANAADWMTRTSSTVSGFWVSGMRTIRLYPIPDPVQIVKACVTAIPTMKCARYDDIVNQYFQALIHGAKAKLMMSPGKPYTNAGAGAYNHAEFKRIVGDAKGRAIRSGNAALSFNLANVV